jgi:hypothetical protein
MSSEAKVDIDDVNGRISNLDTRIDTRITDLENRLDNGISNVVSTLDVMNSKVDLMIQMLQRNFDETAQHKKDVQTSFVHLDEKIQEISDNVQQTKSELWRNIAEQNVRVEEISNTGDAIQAAQERQYNMYTALRDRVEQVEPRLVNLEYEERLIQCMMDTSFTLLCTDIEPEVDDEEVNLTDLEADVLMDELVLELQHISEEFNAMVTKDTVPVANFKVYPGAISTRAKGMHAMKAIYLSTCRVLVLSMSLPCVVLPGVGLQGGVALLRGDVVPETRRVFDPGGLSGWF